MKSKMFIPMIIGFSFATFALPQLAKMSLSAKYKQSNVAYADEKETAATICTTPETASLKDAIIKIKCRKNTQFN